MLFLLFLLYWWGALISGIVLKILGKRQSGQTFRNAQRYAEINGWHPISQTAWRSMKANGASLAINQAFEKSTYILTIEASAGTTTVPDFANPLWALQFGGLAMGKEQEARTSPLLLHPLNVRHGLRV